MDRFFRTGLALMLVMATLGCEQPPSAVPRHPVVVDSAQESEVAGPTPPEVLDQIRELGGTYRLNKKRRVAVLGFHRCPLNDGDLEILRSTPDVWTLNLRGISVVGGELTVAGLQPVEALKNLRRLDLSYNSKFSGSLDVLRPLAELEFLDLQGTRFGDDAMDAVSQLPQLQTLNVGMHQISADGVRALHGSPLQQFNYWRRDREDPAVLGGLKGLKSWFIGFGTVSVDRLGEFHGMDQLENLWISGHEVICPDESIRALRTMKSLQTLQISSPANQDCPILAALDVLPHLKMLRLTSIGDRALQQLPPLPALERLDLSINTHVTAEGLSALQRLPALRHLALRPSHTNAAALAVVAECAQLETLVFDPNRIHDIQDHLTMSYPGQAEPPPGFVAADLRPILERTKLKSLHVDGLGFGDEVLAVAAKGQSLEQLNVSGLPITDIGIQQLRHLEHLKLLDVMGTQVTYTAAENFQREYAPGCRITDNWCCGCLALEPLKK